MEYVCSNCLSHFNTFSLLSLAFMFCFSHCDRVSFILLIHNCCLITLIVQHPIHSFISFIYTLTRLFVVVVFIFSIFFIHPFSHYASVNFCAVIPFKLFSRSKQHDTKRQNQLFENTHKHECSWKLTLLPNGYKNTRTEKKYQNWFINKRQNKRKIGLFLMLMVKINNIPPTNSLL